MNNSDFSSSNSKGERTRSHSLTYFSEKIIDYYSRPMEGKLLILFLLLLCYYGTMGEPSPSKLSGGLVFSEESYQGPTYINQNVYTVMRVADTSILRQAAQATRDLLNKYHAHCQSVDDRSAPLMFEGAPMNTTDNVSNDVGSDDSEYEIVVSPIAASIIDAPEVCASMGARLPEIQTQADKERIRVRAVKEGIKKIAAGIEYDNQNQVFRFKTSKKNIRPGSPFTGIQYGGAYEGATHYAYWEMDYYSKFQAMGYPIIYNHPAEHFVIRIADEKDKHFVNKVLCEKKRSKHFEQVTKEVNLLMILAQHACHRDEPQLTAMTATLLEEIEMITRLKMNIAEEGLTMEDFLPQEHQSVRRSRSVDPTMFNDTLKVIPEHILAHIIEVDNNQSIPVNADLMFELANIYYDDLGYEFQDPDVAGHRVARSIAGTIGLGAFGVTAAMNAASSAQTGDAPLSWVGKILGSIFGLKTRSRAEEQRLKDMSHKIDNLEINQKEFVTAMGAVQDRVHAYGQLIKGSFEATAAIAYEQDIKGATRHMQLLQEATLAKYANILVAAAANTISPYALTQSELATIAEGAKASKNIELTTDLNKVAMSAEVIDNQLTLFFRIPIVQDEKLFHFYRVKPMPIFADNKTLMPIIDTEYVAISKTGANFIILAPDEFTRCITQPSSCQVSNPIMPMSVKTSCVIQTYTTKKLMCDLEETEIAPYPVLHIRGNSTIFSVPSDTRLFIKCIDEASTHKYKDETLTITGMGEAAFREGCTVTLPDGSTFQTPQTHELQQMADLDLYKLLRIFPIPQDIRVRRKADIFDHLAPLSFDDVQMPSWEHIKAEVFHPFKIIPFLAKMLGVLVICLIIGICLWCYWPCLRRTLGKYKICCCCAPLPFEDPDRLRNSRFEEIMSELDKLKLSTQANIAKWKTSTPDLPAVSFRSKSTPDLTLHDVESGEVDEPPAKRPSVHFQYLPKKTILKLSKMGHQ